ncbi:MAG: hypothetical protein IKB97_09190 [Bacteroidaceae bacterium]|nr:hypothetical protein [Bacteroidaceae bacterium]
MANKYLVEFKNSQGKWEPLGIMTRTDAICWAWDHGHPALQMQRVSPKQTRKAKA